MRILVVCGPSGVGKSTLIRALGRRLPGATAFAVSHTTRGPRGGEEDGVHYTFTSEASFAEMVERGEFVEHVCIHGARYGTSRSAIRRVAQGGRLPVLDVDLDGALNVDRAFPGSVCGVYVKPCSMSLLRQRLTARGTETEAQVHGRLSHAAAELERLEAEVDLQSASIMCGVVLCAGPDSHSCQPQTCSGPRSPTTTSPRPGPCLRRRCAPTFPHFGSATLLTLMQRPLSASWDARPEFHGDDVIGPGPPRSSALDREDQTPSARRRGRPRGVRPDALPPSRMKHTAPTETPSPCWPAVAAPISRVPRAAPYSVAALDSAAASGAGRAAWRGGAPAPSAPAPRRPTRHRPCAAVRSSA